MFRITKQFSFCASHQLNGLATWHPCSKVHGHNYIVTIEMSCKDNELSEEGFVLDYRKMEGIKEYIDSTLDHTHLNDVFDFNPTAENMARYLYHLWSVNFPQISAIEISETPKTNARYEQGSN